MQIYVCIVRNFSFFTDDHRFTRCLACMISPFFLFFLWLQGFFSDTRVIMSLLHCADEQARLCKKEKKIFVWYFIRVRISFSIAKYIRKVFLPTKNYKINFFFLFLHTTSLEFRNETDNIIPN